MVEIKGSVLIDAVSWARMKYGNEQMDRLIRLMKPQTKDTFLGEIMRTTWYPLETFVDYIEVELKELFLGKTDYLIEITGEPVEKQLRGIYSLFIKLGSPEFIIKRLAVITDTYFNGIEVKAAIVAPGHATVKYIGFEKQHAVIQYVIMGFYKKALEMSGAKNLKIRFSVPIDEGKAYSEVVITWNPK